MVFQLNRDVRTSCGPKLFGLWRWSELHTRVATELTAREGYRKSLQKHSTCSGMFHVCIAVFVYKTRAETSSPSPSHSQRWPKAILQVPLVVTLPISAAIVQCKRQQWHTSPFGVLVDWSEENLKFGWETARFFHDNRVLCAEMASHIAAAMVSSPDSSSDLATKLSSME